MTTRRPLTLPELTAVLAPLGHPLAVRDLSGGLFAAVQAVDLADGRCVVTKTGQPDGNGGLLTHEARLIRGEIALLRRAEAIGGVPAPRILHTDLTREHVDVDVVALEMLPGTPWQDARPAMTDEADRRAAEEVGGVLAALHTATGDRFGYPVEASGVGGGTWSEAFTVMIDALLVDAERWDVAVDAPRVLAAVAAGRDELAEVTTPRLVHMDLWPGNVLVDPAAGAVSGIVDLERGLFADPLMDFVGHDPFGTGSLPEGPLAGYLAAGGTLPLDSTAGTVSGLTPAADRRLALYRLYLTLIMTIEVVPRRYDWERLPQYLGSLVDNRGTLLAQLGV
jgi:aminoglycoside phosphotransferase (APT) family kinase protein